MKKPPAPHSLVFWPINGLYLRLLTTKAIEDEAARTGKPTLAVIREAIERGMRDRGAA